MKTCCCCPQAFPPARRVKDINVRKTVFPGNIARFPETSNVCPSDNEPEARFVKASNVLWVKETKGKLILNVQIVVPGTGGRAGCDITSKLGYKERKSGF